MGKRILITGSEGLLGGLIRDVLKEEHELILLDKLGDRPIDLLKEDIAPCFNGVDTVFHFAANPRPWISEKEAKENIDMTWKVLNACKDHIRRIIYASSINVYDMHRLYGVEQITGETRLCPNTKIAWRVARGGIYYGISKIVCESLIRSYHHGFGINALNLRLGCVTPDNIPYDNEPEDPAVWLSHEDFLEIIKRSVDFRGYAELVCTSNNEDAFVDLSPIKETLGYFPQSNSKNHKRK